MGLKISHHIKELAELEHSHTNHIEFYKEEKLRELFLYAYNNIEYYRDLINKNGINLIKEDIHDILSGFPFLTKQSIRDNISSLAATNENKMWRSTSGTTGSPLVFFKDRRSISYLYAMMHVAYSWHGIMVGDKQARFWGTSLNYKKKIIQLAKDGLQNRKRLSAFNMSENECLTFFEKLLKFKPRFFYGYANSLYLFSSFLEKKDINWPLDLEAIISTGEMLFDYQRRKIEQFFKCRIVNEYGSTENGLIGFECQYGNMHIMPTVYVEIINRDKNGIGDIVITELNSRSIPFIRYRIGDRGKFTNSSCLCGRPYKLLSLCEGRIDDYILLPNGNHVYDAVLAYCLKDYAFQFKAFQKRIDYLEILIVPKKPFNKTAQGELMNTLRKYLTTDMSIKFIEVLNILPEKSGKKRYFVSEIKHCLNS